MTVDLPNYGLLQTDYGESVWVHVVSVGANGVVVQIPPDRDMAFYPHRSIFRITFPYNARSEYYKACRGEGKG